MGYQENILVCSNKQNFNKLCNKLNSNRQGLKDHVDVFAIAKLKSDLNIVNDYCREENCTIPACSYFVWWGGERHPYQSGLYMDEHERRVFKPQTFS